MGQQNKVSALTAQNATETTKTLIDTVDVPDGVSRLVEIAWQIVMAGVTTLESVSCILEIECDNSGSWIGTQQFLSPVVIPLTSGTVVMPLAIHDCNIPVKTPMKLKLSTTFNVVLTINPSVRIGLKYE
jgi:hypothetical protein